MGGVTPNEILAAIDQAMREIEEDMAKGIVPPLTDNFSALHDYVDANEYGGLTDERAHFDIEDANAVQDAVHQWLQKGRPE